MGIQIGAGWSKTAQDGGTYISFVIDDEAKSFMPQLKELNLFAFHIPQSERKNENSPGWRLVLSKMQDKKKSEEEIPM